MITLEFISSGCFTSNKFIHDNDIFRNDRDKFAKRNSECSYQASNPRPSITSSDALPQSYWRLVVTKTIKQGSWDKHSAGVAPNQDKPRNRSL